MSKVETLGGVEMRARKRVHKETNPVIWVGAFFTALIVLAVTILPYIGPGPKSLEPLAKRLEGSGLKVVYFEANPSTADPPEVVKNLPKKAKNWADVLAWIDASEAGTHRDFIPAGYAEFLEATTGWSRDDVAHFAEIDPEGTLRVEIPKGTILTNTGYNGKSKKFLVYSNYTVKSDRYMLVAPKGYVAQADRTVWTALGLAPKVAYADQMIDEQPGVLESCGNPKPPTPPEKPRPPQDKPKPPEDKPKPPQEKPEPEKDPCDPSLVEQPVQENLAPPTPGVTRGEPEKVKESQDANKDNPNPVPGGKTGEGTGGTTAPDGTKEDAPKPTTPPDTTDDKVNEGDTGMPN